MIKLGKLGDISEVIKYSKGIILPLVDKLKSTKETPVNKRSEINENIKLVKELQQNYTKRVIQYLNREGNKSPHKFNDDSLKYFSDFSNKCNQVENLIIYDDAFGKCELEKLGMVNIDLKKISDEIREIINENYKVKDREKFESNLMGIKEKYMELLISL